MKKVFTLMLAAALALGGCRKDVYYQVVNIKPEDAPPHAASTKTWTFGSSTLMWSDAIQIPECNKTSFDGGTAEEPKADGRSYTHEGKTYYYYSWPYVHENAAQLCPDPWRVPTEDDFEALVAAVAAAQLAAAWGYGGYVSGSSVYDASYGYYWSSTQNVSSSAYGLYYASSDLYVYGNDGKYYGFQVRCVK
jgi:hypothetical protein